MVLRTRRVGELKIGRGAPGGSADPSALIEKAYRLILDRTADEGGAQHFLNQFSQPGFDAIDLVASLLVSPEFSWHGLGRPWVARPAARACLTLLTDRNPSEAAVDCFAEKLRQGLSIRN